MVIATMTPRTQRLSNASPSTTRGWSISKRSRNLHSCAGRSVSQSAADRIPKKTANRLQWAALAARRLRDSRQLPAFASTATASIPGVSASIPAIRSKSPAPQHVAHAQIMEVMGGDIGRNIFFVPLAQRKAATGTDSLGGIGERDALRAQSPAHRDS